MPATEQYTVDGWKRLYGELLALCAAATEGSAARNLAVGIYSAEGRELLVRTFRLIANVLAIGNPGWEADQDHVGYIRSETGRVDALIPFHLVDTFPDGVAMEELVASSERLRVGSISTICLSGSCVFLGVLPFFGDLDFCEYIPVVDGDVYTGIETVAQTVNEHVVCLKLRAGHSQWHRPWDADPPTSEEVAMAVRDVPAEEKHGKLDAILVGLGQGALEASNVLIWLESGSEEEGAAEHSFAFQEVPIGPGWVPRRLAVPETAGKYIHFLVNQIELYRRERPIKALKRALSLASFMLRKDQVDAILELLSGSDALRRDALEQRRALFAKVSSHPDPAVQSVWGAVRDGVAALERSGPEASEDDANGEAFRVATDRVLSTLLGEGDTLRLRGHS